jgi:hypothetical protein
MGATCPARSNYSAFYLRLEVLTAEKMPIVVFWVLKPCSLVTNVSEERIASFFRTEVEVYIKDYKAP